MVKQKETKYIFFFINSGVRRKRRRSSEGKNEYVCVCVYTSFEQKNPLFPPSSIFFFPTHPPPSHPLNRCHCLPHGCAVYTRRSPKRLPPGFQHCIQPFTFGQGTRARLFFFGSLFPPFEICLLFFRSLFCILWFYHLFDIFINRPVCC